MGGIDSARGTREVGESPAEGQRGQPAPCMPALPEIAGREEGGMGLPEEEWPGGRSSRGRGGSVFT